MMFKKVQEGMKGVRRFYKTLEGSMRFKEVQGDSRRFKNADMEICIILPGAKIGNLAASAHFL